MRNLIFVVAIVGVFLFSNTLSEEMRENNIEVPKVEMRVEGLPKEASKPLGLAVAVFIFFLGIKVLAKR